jgi:hypothetical protein
MKTEDAIKHLQKVFKKDPEYRYTWQANIAVSMMDTVAKVPPPYSRKQIHALANEAADRFLSLLEQS